MKKTYVKPELVVESFQLNAATAANCSEDGLVPLGRAENDCGVDKSDEIGGYFVLGSCDFDEATGDGKYDGICYHGPSVQFIYS